MYFRAVSYTHLDVYKRQEWKVLMVKRRNHPSIGWWALPGGFIELHENLEDTARRELTEETGVADLPMEQFAVYGNVTRDPRAVSYTHLGRARAENQMVSDYGWNHFPWNRLLHCDYDKRTT